RRSSRAAKRMVHLGLVARIQYMQPQPKSTCRHLGFPRFGRGVGIGRIDQQRNSRHRGRQLMKQFKPLRRDLDVQDACARLPPGRLRLTTRPALAGSVPTTKMTGIVSVAALAATYTSRAFAMSGGDAVLASSISAICEPKINRKWTSCKRSVRATA